MKYILGLLFNYKKYKKDSSLRIYSNSKFVDEITLDEDIDDKTIVEYGQDPINHLSDAHWRSKKDTTKYPTSPYGLHGYGSFYWDLYMKITNTYFKNATKFFPKNHILEILGMKQEENGELCPVAKQYSHSPKNTDYRPDLQEREFKYPKKIFLYELDEEVINDNVEIFVKNNDNNYTNGFLSKTATVTFHSIFLMPKKFFNDNFVTNAFPRLHKNWLVSYKPRWLYAVGNFIKKDTWPNADGCANIQGPGYNYKLHHGAISYITLGGDLHITIPVIKKHGIKLFGRKNMANGRFLFKPEIINIMKHFDLINTVNEDQRSDNT